MSNNININALGDQDMWEATQQTTQLEDDKAMVIEQEDWVAITRDALRDARRVQGEVEGQSPEAVLQAAKEKRRRIKLALDDHEEAVLTLNRLKRSFLLVHPTEPVFGAVSAASMKNRVQEPLPPRLVKELPGFKFKHDDEPTMIRKDLIHTDVTAFVAHFEKVFAVHGVDIDAYHQQPLSWCLSESLLNHYKSQQATVEDGQSQTWVMAKDWLASFVETPANLIVNVQALFNIRLRSNEQSSAFFARVREARKKVRDEKLTFDQVVAMAVMSTTPAEWQRTFQKEMQVAMKEGHSSEGEVMDLLMKMECEPLTVKRRNDEEVVVPQKRSRVETTSKFPFKKCTNEWVDPATGKKFTCNQGYAPRHNEVCYVLKAKLTKTSANGTPINHRKSNNRQWTNKDKQEDSKKYARAARKQDNSKQQGQAEKTPAPVTVNPKSDLCKSKHAPQKDMFTTIAEDLYADEDQTMLSSDAPIDRICKFSKTAKKENPILNSTSPSTQNVEGEICVPVIVDDVPVMALVDGGANFSALDKSFCEANKITVKPYKEPLLVGLADSKMSSVIYGCTEEIQLHYNYTTYKVILDVMDLAAEREMSIGTDLMRMFGIGYTGLAVSWTPPVKAEDESPFKDVVVPNEDPYGSDAQQSRFLARIQTAIDRNQAIDKHSLCTHPDAVVRLDTPPDAAGFRVQYKVPETLIPKVRETVEKWLEDGVIERVPSTADNRWNSPLTLAPKKDSTGKYTDKRPCLDPRHINKYLKEDRFPLPNINDIFKKFAEAEMYTTLDLTNAFHRFPILPEHRHKTTFTDPDGRQFMFIGCPFGLKPISSKFQRVMTTLFTQPPFQTFVATFVDDIVIYSKNFEEHTHHTQLVIDELTRYNLILNPKKCHFAQKTIYLLGFCVSAKGKSFLDPRKVTNAQEWPIPTTGKDIQQFLGLVNYFHQYLPKAPLLAEPLNALRNHQGRLGNLWTDAHTTSFNKIKESLVLAPYLFSPRPDLPFHVATDASDVGIGAVLYQIDTDGTILHNGFMARALSKSERNYQITKKELLAIIFALNKFHQHLWGRHFTLYTDHKALVYIHSQRDLNAMMVKWFDTLLDYNFDVVHLPGMDNVLPDALSRLFPSVKELGEGNDGKERARVDYAATKDKEIREDKQRISRAIRKAQLQEEYMEPPTEEERKSILEKAHLFGHFGAEAIVKAVHNNGMHWTNIKKEALELVQKCISCQRFNIVKTGYNPHRPVHATLPGDHWAIDLAGELPLTERKNCYLLVMIDICSRFVILRPLQDKTAEAIVQAIIPVFCEFGIPRILQSDNGKEFVNQIMTRFKLKAGFDHRLITPYHPQGNGAAERTVGTAMKTIKKCVEGANDKWDLFVSTAQLAINNKVSKRHNATPFAVMFGRKMNDFKNYNEEKDETSPLTASQIKSRMEELQKVVFPAIEEKTLQTIKKQKETFDKTHQIKDFKIGSAVRIKINKTFRNKMDVVNEGPYEVVRKTENGTYSLRNAKNELEPRNYLPNELAHVADEFEKLDDVYEVEEVVDHKQDETNNKYIYKVKWLNFDDSQNTWEPAENFQSQQCIQKYWKRIGREPRVVTKKRQAQQGVGSKKNRSKRSKHKNVA
jgi:hypothetical protein